MEMGKVWPIFGEDQFLRPIPFPAIMPPMALRGHFCGEDPGHQIESSPDSLRIGDSDQVSREIGVGPGVVGLGVDIIR